MDVRNENILFPLSNPAINDLTNECDQIKLNYLLDQYPDDKRQKLFLLLKEIKSNYALDFFLAKKVPPTFDKSTFLMDVLSQKQVLNFTETSLDLARLLIHIAPEKQLIFCFEKIGKEKITSCITNCCALVIIVKILPIDQRFNFVKEIFPESRLREFRNNDKVHWQNLKLLLNENPEKNYSIELEQLIYSSEEIEAKTILKNIKREIKKTAWNIGLFEKSITKRLGKQEVTIPEELDTHIQQFNAISSRSASHIEALSKIKEIGKAEYQKNSDSFMSHSFLFSNSNINKYFEKFKDEETIQKMFGKP